MESRKRIAILTFKSPTQIEGGLDIRTMGIARALSMTATVSLIPIFGGSIERKVEPQIELLGSTGFEPASNHQILRWLKNNPDDPYGVFLTSEIQKSLMAKLEELEPDIVIASRLSTWRILESLEWNSKAALILDLDESAARLNESFSQRAASEITWKFYADFHARTARFEAEIINRPEKILVSSDLEATEIAKRVIDKDKIRIAPNIVIDDRQGLVEQTRSQRPVSEILFPANFAYPPNRTALQEIVESIAPHLPEYRFRIAGANLDLENRKIPANMTLHSPIQSMADEFHRADLLIAPLRWGAGTRIKILEAMRWQVPVIATEFAAEGLNLRPGTHYISAETPEEFVESIRDIAKDDQYRYSITESAYRFISERFTVTALARALDFV